MVCKRKTQTRRPLFRFKCTTHYGAFEPVLINQGVIKSPVMNPAVF